MAYTEPIHAAVLTFSCFAEGNVGMKIEQNQIAKDGKNRALDYNDLTFIRNVLRQDKVIPHGSDHSYALHYADSREEPAAWCLVLKDGMRHLGVNKDVLLNEIQSIPEVDKQMLNTRQNKVMNKHKRHNFNIGDKSVEADIPNGQSTLYNFNAPFLSEANKLRNVFSSWADKYPSMLTLKNLLAEANVYYADEYKKNNYCGIGYHGDAERPDSPVIGCNVGTERYLSFRAFYKNRYFNDHETRIKLEHGDIYFMSANAVGVNWKKSAQIVFRHRAGSLKFLEKDNKDRQRRWSLARRKALQREKRKEEMRDKRLLESVNAMEEEAKKRKREVAEVKDREEVVEKDGKKYKKITRFFPLVDLTSK